MPFLRQDSSVVDPQRNVTPQTKGGDDRQIHRLVPRYTYCSRAIRTDSEGGEA